MLHDLPVCDTIPKTQHTTFSITAQNTRYTKCTACYTVCTTQRTISSRILYTDNVIYKVCYTVDIARHTTYKIYKGSLKYATRSPICYIQSKKHGAICNKVIYIDNTAKYSS